MKKILILLTIITVSVTIVNATTHRSVEYTTKSCNCLRQGAEYTVQYTVNVRPDGTIDDRWVSNTGKVTTRTRSLGRPVRKGDLIHEEWSWNAQLGKLVIVNQQYQK